MCIHLYCSNRKHGKNSFLDLLLLALSLFLQKALVIETENPTRAPSSAPTTVRRRFIQSANAPCAQAKNETFIFVAASNGLPPTEIRDVLLQYNYSLFGNYSNEGETQTRGLK